jgi:hypothetical protein
MQGTEFQFPLNGRVRLRDGISPEFYGGWARTGNEGWITERRKDHHNLPEVFVKWDEAHWAYNRQQDCWTYEEHFDLVEETMSEEQNDQSKALEEVTSAFVGALRNILAPQQEPPQLLPSPVEAASDASSRASEYAEMVARASEILHDSEAFAIVSVSRKDDPRAPAGQLAAIVVADSLTPESEALVGAQLSTLANRYHNDTALMLIGHLTDGSE